MLTAVCLIADGNSSPDKEVAAVAPPEAAHLIKIIVTVFAIG